MVGGYLNILMLYARSTNDHTAPAGWDEFLDVSANGNRLKLFSRSYVGGDGNPTITHAPAAAANDSYAARIFTYKSDAGLAVLDSFTSGNTGIAAEDIGPFDGIAGLTGQIVCAAGGRRDDVTSIATLTVDGLTWNEHWDEGSTVGNDLHVAFQDTLLVGDVTVSSATFDVTLGAGPNQQWAAGMFVIGEVINNFIPRIVVI